MIKIVEGDLLEAKENIIVHQVNTRGVMGSGVALQIKKKYPVVYEEYVNRCNSVNKQEDLLGHVHFEEVENGKYVANLFGQLDYGSSKSRYTNYEALFGGLERVRYVAEKYDLTVAIPYKIGSDRGGADWGVVYAMIESIFHGYSVTIYRLKGV